MSTQSRYPDSRIEPQAAREWTADTVAERNAEERADIAEDRSGSEQPGSDPTSDPAIGLGRALPALVVHTALRREIGLAGIALRVT